MKVAALPQIFRNGLSCIVKPPFLRKGLCNESFSRIVNLNPEP